MNKPKHTLKELFNLYEIYLCEIFTTEQTGNDDHKTKLHIGHRLNRCYSITEIIKQYIKTGFYKDKYSDR